MSTLIRENKPSRGLLRSNPVLSRLSKITERSQDYAATYAGIARKTSFFLLMTLVGLVAQLVVMNAMGNEPVWQEITINEQFTLELTQKEAVIFTAVVILGFVAELLGIFVRKTIPVTGTLYSISQGYVISFLVFKVLNGYEYLGMEALLLTVAVVFVMSWLYSSGIVKADSKFRTVLLSLMLGSLAFGLLTFIGSLIPATRPFVQAMMNNSFLVIAMDVIGLVIAAGNMNGPAPLASFLP